MCGVSELPFLYQGDLPDPGIELVSLMSPVVAGGFFTTKHQLGSPCGVRECSNFILLHVAVQRHFYRIRYEEVVQGEVGLTWCMNIRMYADIR